MDGPPGAVRCGPARRVRRQCPGKGGAATAALILQCLGAALVVAVQPTHHGLWVAAGALRHLRGARALGNIVKRQEPLATVGMGRTEGHLTQIRLRLAPMVVVNS